MSLSSPLAHKFLEGRAVPLFFHPQNLAEYNQQSLQEVGGGKADK